MNSKESSDVCTQLQDQLDLVTYILLHYIRSRNSQTQIGTQICTTLQYLNSKHDYLPFEGQLRVPYVAKYQFKSRQLIVSRHNEKDPVQADDIATFENKKREMASALIAAIKRFESTIDILPGLDTTEEQQLDQIKQLERELSVVEDRKARALSARAKSQEMVELLISKIASSIKTAG